MSDTTFDITFRLERPELPTVEQQYENLWRFAKAFVRAGLPITDWYPPASTVEASTMNRAFSDTGPTTAALAMARADKETYPSIRGLGAWNGIEGYGGIVMTDLLSTTGLCTCKVDADIPGLNDVQTLISVVTDVIDIWSPSSIQVGPYKYFTQKQVFENRLGVGWMLYLPRVLSVGNVPEARALIPVMNDKKKQKGTIVVSVADEAFDVNNPSHVEIANSIEIRLVNQDMLPHFTDL